MIDMKVHRVKTIPYLVETRKNTSIKVFKYLSTTHRFEEITLQSDGSQYYFYVCRDEHDNLMLVNTYNLYFIHYDTITSKELYDIFTVCRKADEHEIKDMLNNHSTIKIKNK